MDKTHPVLIISGEWEHRAQLAEGVSRLGLRPVCCGTLADARALMLHESFSAALSEKSLPDATYHDVIREVRQAAGKKAPVVIVSESDGWNSYLSTLVAGAFDSVPFPPQPGELELVLCIALNESRHKSRPTT